MKAIVLREIKSFFGSPIGYLVIAVFLVLNGLFLWVFDGEYNILNAGFADLTLFFTITPWILIFLIPAVTMRSFSDEKKLGTIELLLTKPLSVWQIVNGKFVAAVLLILIALVPTYIYVEVISELGISEGSLDMGSIFGSYFGLLFLIGAYTSIGVFTSTLSDNQIVAFILAVFLCFFFYFGFEGLSTVLKFSFIPTLGMQDHFKSISRGVIDTRDVVYFLSLTVFFLFVTVLNLKSLKFETNAHIRTNIKHISILISALLMLNLLGGWFFYRLDLTTDKRYTLSEVSLKIIEQVKAPLVVKIYMSGDVPTEFRRLQQETKQLLEEFQAYNFNIVFEFINPLEGTDDENMENIKELYKKGLTPVNITVDDKGKQSQSMVFPWIIAVYENKEVNIPLLKNIMGASTTQKVVHSIQHLEYSIADGFNKIVRNKQKKIAILKGNDELGNAYIAKFLLQVRESYFIAPFTLDSVAKNPRGTLAKLKEYDLAIIAKPTAVFTDAEKQTIDQYIVSGGKTIWLIDQVNAEMDSLQNSSGTSLAFPRDLSLGDLFFKYGVRLNPILVKDERAAPIKLATGEQGSNTRLEQFVWKFAPLVYPDSQHPIVKNLGGIRFDFVSSMDTLKNDIKKTILLQSSPYSKKVGVPFELNINSVFEKTSPEDYKDKGNIPLAVLLEGGFRSVYENRVLAFDQKDFMKQGKPNKMIVIADGDLIKNQLDKDGFPLELGFDQRTGNLYDNKDFLINCVNYLLDDNGLINLRTKDVEMALLDKEKVYDNYTTVQVVTVGVPLAVLLIFGLLFTYLRKRKYSKVGL